MSIFIDTGPVYELQNARARDHEDARMAMHRVILGEFGNAFTSDYIFDEATTLARSKMGGLTAARSLGNRILGRDPYPEALSLQFVTEDDFVHAWTIMNEYADQPLSFTDATTVALMERLHIDHLLSFDDDFDGLVDRLDPRDL